MPHLDEKPNVWKFAAKGNDMLIGKIAVAACIATSLSVVMTTAQAQQAQNFGKGHKVHLLPEMKLSNTQRDLFSQFKSKATYFSYFSLQLIFYCETPI
ncbi:MAG: hypothetical protein WA782_09230 [Sulfitobacter sp.]